MRFFVLLCLASSLAPAVHAIDGPFALRNIHPIALLYGLPRPLGTDPVVGTEMTFNIEHANNFSSERDGSSFFFFDGETSLLTYGVRRAFNERWEWGIEIPWVVHSGGEIDALIDGFHDLFGMDDGGRDNAPRGRLDYLVRFQGEDFADFDDRESHLGDVRASLGYRLVHNAARALVVRGMVKAPTGNVDSLSGSEATDVSVSVDYSDSQLLSRLGLELSLMGAVVWLGEGELAPNAQNDWVGVGHLGLRYRVNEHLELLGQVEAHTELLDSGVEAGGGSAIQGTLGARVNLTPRAWMDLALVEDLRSHSSPDVVFNLRLGVVL